MSRHKKLAHVIASGKVKTAYEALTKVGFSSNTASKQSSRVIKNKEVQNELKRIGFTENDANSVIGTILKTPVKTQLITPSAQIEAAKEVFKVLGRYAPDKHINLNASLSDLLNAVHKDDPENVGN